MIGLEILPENHGTIRFEGSYLYGSQLPLNNFNQAEVNDAEESNGGSGRVLLTDPGRNITVDAGFTIARFTNPVDPLLSQGIEIVPVEETTRQARYADVTWDVFRDAMLLDVLPARLNVAFRHERVDPLYRAVGANVRSDNLQNTYELHSGVGPLQLDLTHLRSEDNLAEIESVLKSKTRQTGANVALPPAASAGILPPWLPTLSYGLNNTHQFGVSTPTNSEFIPDRVPDQVTISHTAGIEWQGGSLRVGPRGTHTTQDNRQAGRENADAVNRTNGLNISFSPVTQISMSLEGSLESSENTETGVVIRNRRVGANLLAPLLLGATASLNALNLLLSADMASAIPGKPVDLSWMEISEGSLYRVVVIDPSNVILLNALLRSGVGAYRLPPWIWAKTEAGNVSWSVEALDDNGDIVSKSEWRTLLR